MIKVVHPNVLCLYVADHMINPLFRNHRKIDSESILFAIVQLNFDQIEFIPSLSAKPSKRKGLFNRSPLLFHRKRHRRKPSPMKLGNQSLINYFYKITSIRH